MENLGATGKFPHGKLNEFDEGELQLAVGIENQSVVVNFGTPVVWIGMTADHADALANNLKEKAFELRKEEIVPDDIKDQIELFATSKLFAENIPPVKFELDMVLTVGLIGQLQIAFRHPSNVGPTRQHLEKFVRDLIDRIDPTKGDVHRFLMMGFNEAYDE